MAVHSDTKTTPTSVEPSPEVDSTDVSVSAAKTYRKVFTFSGNGAKKSELFTVYGERFKIVYECEGDPALTLCQAFAYEIGSGLPQLIMNTGEAITDETIMYGKGLYYIDANVIGDFTMTVYDYN
jgi:hypothetical protein